MTRAELFAVLPTLAALDPVSAHDLAEACLLAWLVAEGEAAVVEAYVAALARVGVLDPLPPPPSRRSYTAVRREQTRGRYGEPGR